MATETGRDDFIISIRYAFLNKGTRQKFSLFTLLIVSILVLSLEYFKTGPIDKLRSITKDIILAGEFIKKTTGQRPPVREALGELKEIYRSYAGAMTGER